MPISKKLIFKGSNSKNAVKKEFSLFPKLPIELRCKIWKHALPGPRYIEIRSTCEMSKIDTDTATWSPFCTEVVPVLFFVCRESRAEVVKTYIPFRGDEAGSTTVYCNFEVDFLCLTSKCFHDNHLEHFVNSISQFIKTIRYIIADDSIFCTFDRSSDTDESDESFDSFHTLTQFPALRELCVVPEFCQELRCSFPSHPEKHLFTIANFEDWSSEDSAVRTETEPWLRKRGWSSKKEGAALVKTLECGFSCVQVTHPEWNPPLATSGLLTFVDQCGVQWSKYNELWSCSAAKGVRIFQWERSENECWCDGNDDIRAKCNPFHIVRTPGFDLRLCTSHIPCHGNTYYPPGTL